MISLGDNLSSEVVMLIPSYFPVVGGAERQLAQLAQHLQDKRQKLCILTRRISGTPSIENMNHIQVNRTFANLGTWSFFISAFWFLLRHRRRYEMIHVHTTNSPAFLAVLIKILLDKKVIVKVTRTGKGSALARLDENILGKVFFIFLKRWVDRWIAINQEAYTYLKCLGIADSRLVLLPNGVDTNLFKPVTVEERRRARNLRTMDVHASVLLFVGRLIKRKNVDLVIRALAQLKNDLHLWIAGDGPEREVLESLAKDLGLAHRVKFFGPLSSDELRTYLPLANYFILPSETEGISNALLEAMACGLIPIVSRVPGNIDVVCSENHGFTFDLNQQSALLETLRGLSSLSEEHLCRLSFNSRNRVLDSFSLDSVTQRYLDLYATLRSA